MTSSTFSRIICRGTELMAAFPTGWSSPRFVTRPTPSPPSICTPRLVRPADRGKNERAFRHIGVVPAVLFDGAGDAVRAHRDLTHGELEPDALRRIERDGLLPPAGEQHPCRRLGRRRGARAGRISEPETLAVLFDVLFHVTAGSDRAARCRWRRRRCCRPCGRGR